MLRNSKYIPSEYTAKGVVFSRITQEAVSFGRTVFLTRVGKFLVLNVYPFHPESAQHVQLVLALLEKLKMKIDCEICIDEDISLPDFAKCTLKHLYLEMFILENQTRWRGHDENLKPSRLIRITEIESEIKHLERYGAVCTSKTQNLLRRRAYRTTEVEPAEKKIRDGIKAPVENPIEKPIIHAHRNIGRPRNFRQKRDIY